MAGRGGVQTLLSPSHTHVEPLLCGRRQEEGTPEGPGLDSASWELFPEVVTFEPRSQGRAEVNWGQSE